MSFSILSNLPKIIIVNVAIATYRKRKQRNFHQASPPTGIVRDRIAYYLWNVNSCGLSFSIYN